MRRIHDHLVIVVSLQQRFVARGQLVCVLRHVRCRDREQRLVGRVRIRVMIAGLVARRRDRDAPGPRRNRAVCIAGFFAAETASGLCPGDRPARR